MAPGSRARLDGELDLIETPIAFAALDGDLVTANRAFRAWSASEAAGLGEVLGIDVRAAVEGLRAGKPQVVKATARTPRGRAMPVEYQLRLVQRDGSEAIAIEGRDLSRVHEKEAMLQAFARTIEVNNRSLVSQKAEIAKLLDEVGAAYAAVQRLLDAADQGFATLDREARLLPGRSAAFDRWFDAPPVGTPFASCLHALNPDVAAMFELFWQQIERQLLPLDVLLDMLPTELHTGRRWFRLSYKSELDGAGELVTLLLVISDITDEIERSRIEAQQHELASLLARLINDRPGLVQFVREADALIVTITAPLVARVELYRAVHTLKGSCALFGAAAMAKQCHELEDRLSELGDAAADLERGALGESWRALRHRVAVFLEYSGDDIWIARAELDELRRRLPAMSTDEVLGALETWTWESATRRLTRIGVQLREVAARLERGPVDVVIDGGGLRLDPVRWSGFWSSMVHLVVNAVDHGIDPPEQRAALGKPPSARMTLRTWVADDRVVFELGDDGRGIDWAAVARKAGERGLDITSQAALVQSLFVDGISTRATVDAQSGRGVGLAAVRAACERLSGAIEVDSEPGRGTVFRFRFPAIGVAVRQDADLAPERSVA
jgi:HPt (histidine-containing phosphotransfer) domain-containing protein/two-component sensor histidine kinase